MHLSSLWKSPKVNPLTGKAYSVPVLNPIDKYGRTFYFSTFGFMIAFMSWYAFPPLLSKTIKADLELSQAEIANSNILALAATLLVRLFVGPLCDKFGPRLVFAYILLAGAIPTALAGTVTNATGLIIIRFFVGVLGGTFVPCQVWSTGFFDKEVVGTANALMAGIGNAGGGITYFVMPAVFDSLVKDRGLTPHKAWRVAFIVPAILITATALGMIFLCEDTPTGSWKDRHVAIHSKTDELEKTLSVIEGQRPSHLNDNSSMSSLPIEKEKKSIDKPVTTDIEAAHIESSEDIKAINAEIVVAPTAREMLKVFFSPQTLILAASYGCSFGGELAINSILGAYYIKNFGMTQTESGRWASMFGLVNVLFRPLGGLGSDFLYRKAKHNVHVKKYFISFLGICMGAAAISIGLVNSHNEAIMFCLVVLMALFMDSSNGANFALVPHVHPSANGIISGIVGAGGNLGGIIFALLFRFNGSNYGKVIWIFGAVSIGINIIVAIMKTIPKGQIGGR